MSPTALMRYTDAAEGAFTLILPRDWRVQSGVARTGADPRPWYRVLSPGGGAELRGSDPRVPVAFLSPPFPFGVMPMPGVVPRPLVPPEVFADEYARAFAREVGASTYTRTGARDLEAMLRGDPRPASRPRMTQMIAAGALFGGVTFACDDLGVCGLVDVCVLRMPGPMGMRWSPLVTAMRGPATSWAHAQETLWQIARSYETHPQWQRLVSAMMAQQHHDAMASIEVGGRILSMQAQSGMEAIAAHAQRAQIAAQTAAEMNAGQVDAWRAQQSAGDEAQRRAVNAIGEVVDLYDPTTGQVLRGAPAGYTSWWTDGASTVVGADGRDNPDAARLRPLVDLDDVSTRRDGR